MTTIRFLWIFFALSFAAPVCLPADTPDLKTIVKKVQPSTVLIQTYDKSGGELAIGSGFFISPEGDVITNYHVLWGAARAQIKTSQGKTFNITKILDSDELGDLLRLATDIPADQVHPLTLSKELPESGERVAVIGNPLGLEQTVSDGIVSAVRDLPGYGHLIQISAPISPGSSGGPVVNMNGEVIGVARLQLTVGQNLNFAAPAEKISKLGRDNTVSFDAWKDAAQNAFKQKWSDSAEGLFQTGLGYCTAREYEKAAESFEQVIRIKPDFAEAHHNLGVSYGELGREAEAVESFKQAIRIKPDFVEAHHNLGVSYSKLGREAEAVEEHMQAIRLKPDYADAHYCLGVDYHNLGRVAEEIQEYEEAIRLKPNHPKAHVNLGAAYGKLGRVEDMVQEYKQAIRINPDDALAHYNLGTAYARNQGRWEEAAESFKQAIRIKPDYADAHNNLGWAYGELGREAEAVEAFKQAIRIKPDYAMAHHNLGMAFLTLGDRNSALAEYKILKDLDSDLANKLFNEIYK